MVTASASLAAGHDAQMQVESGRDAVIPAERRSNHGRRIIPAYGSKGSRPNRTFHFM